jgi:hypothetical protein
MQLHFKLEATNDKWKMAFRSPRLFNYSRFTIYYLPLNAA